MLCYETYKLQGVHVIVAFHVNFMAHDTCIRRQFEADFLPLIQVILLYIKVPKCSIFLPDLDFLTDRPTILGNTI